MNHVSIPYHPASVHGMQLPTRQEAFSTILQENPIAEPHHPEEDMPLITELANLTLKKLRKRTSVMD
ncbi:hypothetical protein DPEC_G00192820 [Dallia pectoralis]|uniref:Uncharacterized protein n=1 Tax=Dallia pectoralis TaxID=75939 RepID=A0ACC2GCH1_DALPE|nr:hypothetical protein DPEC_G00192820 [Dallia pectoralis]